MIEDAGNGPKPVSTALLDRSDRQRNQAGFVNIPLAKGLAASV
jgi:hypothetical protein